jgi:hypothetical protein
MRSILVWYQYKMYATTVPNSLIAVERENCSLYCSVKYDIVMPLVMSNGVMPAI